MQGWVKLNTNGASLGNLGVAGGGGVIRDECGEWVVGFARNIGVANNFIVELWAFRDGLSLCIDRNFNCVEVELDAKSIIDTLNSPRGTNTPNSSLVDDYRLLATWIPQVRFKHCYREAYRSADKLAKLGAAQEDQFILLNSLPVDVIAVLGSNLVGMCLSRTCPEPIFVS